MTDQLLSVAEALTLMLAEVKSLPPRRTLLGDALGLVLAESIDADLDLPPFDKSLMDGYAVRSADFEGMTEVRSLVVAEITAGRLSSRQLGIGEVSRIMTGAPLPGGADAIIPVERTRVDTVDSNYVWLMPQTPVLPGQFRLQRGREVRQGDRLVDSGTTIRAGTIGLIGSAGRATVQAIPRPAIAIIPTGDETVPVGQTPGLGQIRDANGPMLNALVQNWGATTISLSPSVPDDPTALTATFEHALRDHDILIISGGVSAGILDLVPTCLRQAEVKQVWHKVAVKPGKPIWFGVGPARSDGRPGPLVFGLPGNPASGVVSFLLFVRPALDALAGRGANPSRMIPVILGSEFHHRGDRPKFHPARLAVNQVYPLDWAGSADLRTVALADGFVRFDAGSRYYPVGSEVEFLPLP